MLTRKMVVKPACMWGCMFVYVRVLQNHLYKLPAENHRNLCNLYDWCYLFYKSLSCDVYRCSFPAKHQCRSYWPMTRRGQPTISRLVLDIGRHWPATEQGSWNGLSRRNRRFRGFLHHSIAAKFSPSCTSSSFHSGLPDIRVKCAFLLPKAAFPWK